MVLEKTLESPLGCKNKPAVLKEINPEYTLEELMLKVELQYNIRRPPDMKSQPTGKVGMLGKTEAKGEEGGRG